MSLSDPRRHEPNSRRTFSRRRGEMNAAEQIRERAQLCAPEPDAREAETEEQRLMRLLRFAEVFGR